MTYMKLTEPLEIYISKPNRRGCITQPQPPVGLKVEAAMASAEINAELVWTLRTSSFPPGMHDCDPRSHYLIEGVSKCIISRQEAQAKFIRYHEITRWSLHWWLQTELESGGSGSHNCHFQNGETVCCHLTKRLSDNSTIFAAEATAITLALNHYRHMGPVHHVIVVYFDSVSCLQVINAKDTEKPLFAISWNSSGYWVTKAYVFISAGYQALWHEENERVNQWG